MTESKIKHVDLEKLEERISKIEQKLLFMKKYPSDFNTNQFFKKSFK